MSQTYTYELTCTDCSFSTVVEGDTTDVLDVTEAHQAEASTDFDDHFVNAAAKVNTLSQ